MADVKWVKITTDIFDNRKIKHLRKLKNGNDIVLIWIMLLTIAGRCNSGGKFFLTENVPYTSKTLAEELGFRESIINTALECFEELNMIRGTKIIGWEEYQNTNGMDRIREQNRNRKKAQREREMSRDSHVTERDSHATDIDKEEDIEIDIKKINKRNLFSPPSLTDVKRYCQIRNNGINPEAFVDYYESKGWMIGKNKMKDWKAAVRTWEQRATPEEKSGKKTFDTSELDALINKF